MTRTTTTVLYGVAMAGAIIAMDYAFFRHRTWERLAMNVGLVLVFGALYFRFLRRP
jgi:hypothetical protein